MTPLLLGMNGWIYWPWLIVACILSFIWICVMCMGVGVAWSAIWNKKPLDLDDARMFVWFMLAPAAIVIWPISLIVFIAYAIIYTLRSAEIGEMDISPRGFHNVFSEEGDGTKPAILELQAAQAAEREALEASDVRNPGRASYG